MITGAETAQALAKPVGIQLEGRLPVLQTAEAAALGLRDGQVVEGPVALRDGQLKLLLQGRAIDLPPGLQAKAGERLALVAQMGPAGLWQLRPQAMAAAANPAPVLGGALERLWFRPPGMEALLQLLQPGAMQALLRGAPDPALAELLQRWVRRQPSMGQLTPDGLRQAVVQSGWMSEKHLLQGRGVLAAQDLKNTLRELLRTWGGAPTKVSELIGRALEELEARQLQTLETPGGREPTFLMALPFRDFDPVSMRWQRGRRRPGQQHAPLTVHLHSRSQALGELWLQTRIAEQTQVELVMWALREDVVLAAQRASGELRESLGDAGLQVQGLQFVHGRRPAGWDEADGPVPDTGSVVDTQA